MSKEIVDLHISEIRPRAVDPRGSLITADASPSRVRASSWTATGAGPKKRALNRLKGHKAGIEAVREAIRCASDLGVRYLTIYSFSTENWKRPRR